MERAARFVILDRLIRAGWGEQEQIPDAVMRAAMVGEVPAEMRHTEKREPGRPVGSGGTNYRRRTKQERREELYRLSRARQARRRKKRKAR